MKTRALLVFLFAVCCGLALPFFAQSRQLYYLFFLLIAALTVFFLKKGEVTVYDWLVVFIFTIPFHDLRIGGQVHFLRLSEIAFIFLFIWYLAEKNKNPSMFKMPKVFFLILAFLAINILAISKSLYPLISAKRVLVLLYLIIFCYLVSDIVKEKRWIFFLARAMIIISALSAVLAVFQVFIPQLQFVPASPLVNLGSVILYRASAGWGDPNYYALYLVMNFSLSLSLIFLPGLKRKGVLKTAALLQVAGVVATFSRMGFICLLGVIFYNLFNQGRVKTVLILVLAVVIAGAFVLVNIEDIYEKYPLAQAYLFRQPGLAKLQEYPRLILVDRWDAFRANWQMFVENPLLGVGPFMAMYNYGKYKPDDALAYNREILDSHNQYLQLLAEKGIFGLLTFLGFIFMVWKKINYYLGKAGKDLKALALGLKGALLAYLIACFVAQATYEVQFWLTIGLSLALINILERYYAHN
jgi:O-antigen ligase